MRIDPKYLQNLLAIAQHGSFNRAAEARGISQPALSASIAQLEHKLGVAVLERGPRGSTLTPYGTILVRHAQTVEAQMAQALEEVHLRGLGVEGPLRIGATPSVAQKFLPQVLESISKAGGAMSISILEGLDDHLMPLLQSGELDLVVGPLSSLFRSAADIVETPLFDDPLGLAVSPRSNLARRKMVTLSDVADGKWVLPGPGSAYRRQIEALFLSNNVAWPTDCIMTNSLSTVEYLVTHSDRISVISRLQTVFFNCWHIRRVALRGAGTRTIGFKWRKSSRLSALTERLIQVAREIARAEEGLRGRNAQS